jgi:dienelactone hydrolase
MADKLPQSGSSNAHDDDLKDFERRAVEFDGTTRDVFVSGTQGSGVVVMPEMPGISPEVVRFARWVRDAGFVVYVPSLFGRPGAASSVEEGSEVMKRACVSAEFRVFAGGGTSPVVGWLRKLAKAAHDERGGRGVGVVGMCFTGNFALTMALEPSVIAPVLSQPSLPLDQPGGLELSDDDAAHIKTRFEADGLVALGLRFEGDRWCTAERFAAYESLLGERFCPRVLPGSSANPIPPPFHAEVVGSPHSVLTAHLVDEEGHPTVEARDTVLAFLAERLREEGGPVPGTQGVSAT